MKKLPIVRLNEEHFEREDGTRFAKIYGSFIYYHDNGTEKHIDEYKLIDGEEVSNNCDEFNVKVKDNKISYKASNKTVNVEVLGLYVDDTLLYELSDKVVGDNYIQWKLGDKVDYKLTITPYRVQEEIIFKSNPLIGLPIDGEHIHIKYKNSGDLKTKEPWCIDGNNKPVPLVVTKDTKGISVRSLYTSTYPITLDPTVSPNPTSDSQINLNTGVYTRVENTSLTVRYYAYDACGTPVAEYSRAYLRFDLSSMASYTINSAILYLYRHTGSLLVGVVGIASANEVDPESGTPSTVFNNATIGSIIGNYPTSIGYGTGITTTTHVNTHKGGFCDFGLYREQSNSNNDDQFYSSENASNKPYLYVDYTTGAGAPAFIPQVIFI